MPFLVDEHIALGVGELQELFENFIDSINVVLIENQAFLSDIVTVGDDGPPPESTLIKSLQRAGNGCSRSLIYSYLLNRKNQAAAPAPARTSSRMKTMRPAFDFLG